MIASNATDVRAILRKLDVPPFLATMSVPFMFLLPTTSDPDSPSVIEIIKGLQRGLRKLGYKDIKVTGVFDSQTAFGVDQVSAPKGSWRDKTWLQISGDIIAAMSNPRRKAHLMAYSQYSMLPPVTIKSRGLGSLGGGVDWAYGPLPSKIAGTPRGALGLGNLSMTNLRDIALPGYDNPQADAVALALAQKYIKPQPTVDPGLSFALGARDKSNCVPMSAATTSAFKTLQRQINRVLSIARKAPVAEDGILGKSTITAFQSIENILQTSLPSISSCSAIAAQAVSLAALLNAEANARGVSASANSGSKKPATEPPGKIVTDAEKAAAVKPGMLDMVKQYWPFAALAGGVAVAVVVVRKMKGKR